MHKLKVTIVTPRGVAYESEADGLFAATTSGRVGILPRHIPLVTLLKPGELSVRKAGVELPMAVSGGILEIRPYVHEAEKTVTPIMILADHIEEADEIDRDRASQAYDRAKEAMAEKSPENEEELVHLQAKIEKELNRIKIADKYRRPKI